MTRDIRIRWLALVVAGILFLSGCSGGGQTEPEVKDLGGLICMEYSRYTGPFPEDGSGRAVEEVAAIRVHNSSSRFLDYATVYCDIAGSTGTFQVTGLPPGGTAWVLEQNAMTLSEGDPFVATECEDYFFREDAVMSTDALEVSSVGSTLTVTNRSGKTLENVCLYYKNVHDDGAYFGGITYMLDLGTLIPGGTASKQSSHYGEDAKIVRFSFQESG